MSNIIDIPNSITGWITVISFIIAGIVAIARGTIVIFDKTTRIRRAEKDGVESTLITRLEQQVKVLETDVSIFKTKYEEAVARLDKATVDMQNITHENIRLSEILENRDENTRQYQKEARIAIQNVIEVHKIAMENNQLNKSILENIEKLMVVLTEIVHTLGGGEKNA